MGFEWEGEFEGCRGFEEGGRVGDREAGLFILGDVVEWLALMFFKEFVQGYFYRFEVFAENVVLGGYLGLEQIVIWIAERKDKFMDYDGRWCHVGVNRIYQGYELIDQLRYIFCPEIFPLGCLLLKYCSFFVDSYSIKVTVRSVSILSIT